MAMGCGEKTSDWCNQSYIGLKLNRGGNVISLGQENIDRRPIRPIRPMVLPTRCVAVTFSRSFVVRHTSDKIRLLSFHLNQNQKLFFLR